MDIWGILILVIFGAWYLLTRKQHPALLFLSGIGGGILIGAIWALVIINSTFP